MVAQKLARALLKYNLLRSISVLLVQVCAIYELSTWLLDLKVDYHEQSGSKTIEKKRLFGYDACMCTGNLGMCLWLY